MPKHRRPELMEESSGGVSGEDPEYGAIFMSSNSTRKECLRRELFGLPIRQAGFVKKVKAGMMLFLFEFESRELHGVFQACSDGAINIDPDAFCSSGKQFPAQVKFVEKWHCRPLREMEFRHAISENYFTATKFNFGLSQAQAHKLLKLFSLKKVDISQQRKPAVAKPTRKYESSLGNTAGESGIRNRCAEDTDGDDDCEFPFRATSAGDLLGHRLTENNGFGDESDIDIETIEKGYSRDASRICRRLIDPKLHGSKDRVGYEFSMNNSTRTDGVTNYSGYYNANDRSDPKILRHTASGWPESENHEKDGFTHAKSWSNHKEHLSFEADPMVHTRSSVPLESPYGTKTGHYDPCEPGIMGYATMKRYRHDIRAPKVDSVGSPSFKANSNNGLSYGLREEIVPVGGHVSDSYAGYYDPYEPGIMGDAMRKSSRCDFGALKVDSMGSPSFTANSNHVQREEIVPVVGYHSDTLPSETVKRFHHEHNGTSMNKTSHQGSDYYFPVRSEHHEYQTNTGRTRDTCSESESESRYDRLRHSQHPDFLTSAGATENIRNSDSLSYSRHNISPSFAYPLSSRDLSPKDRVNYESSAYQQHHEEFEGHASYSKDRVDRDSRIYPSFTYPSKSGDGVDLYRENRTQNKVQAYQHHEESGGDAFDSNKRMIRTKDIVNPAELERKETRKSVFSRLALPSKESEAEKDYSPDTESVDEVMAFLNGCHKHWMEKKRPNITNHGSFGKPKKKTEKIHTKEVLENDLMLPVTETSPDDLLDREENMEHNDQKRPFIDFKRRSKGQKSLDSSTQGCSKDSPGNSAPQNRKRKLMRPKLIEDESEKNRGNNDNSTENVLASQSSASEVPVHDLLGHGDR